MIDTLIRLEGRGEQRDTTGRILKITDEFISVDVEEQGVKLFSRAPHGREILREGYISGLRVTDQILERINREYPVETVVARPLYPVRSLIEETPEYGRIYRVTEPQERDPEVKAFLERLREAQYPVRTNKAPMIAVRRR